MGFCKVLLYITLSTTLKYVLQCILVGCCRGQLHSVASGHWTDLTDAGRERMSRMAAAASWGLTQWDSMDQYVSCIPRDTTDGAFYRAVLAVHREQYATAQQVKNINLKQFGFFIKPLTNLLFVILKKNILD